MAAFLALGNCTLDDVVSPEGRIAAKQLGGNGVYAAAGMRLWGAKVSLVSVVGTDFPRQWLRELAGAGIDTAAVRQIDAPHRLRSRAFYLPDGRRTDRIDDARSILPTGAGAVIDLVSEYPDLGSPLHRQLWPLFSPLPDQLQEVGPGAVGAHLAPGPLDNSRANARFLKTLCGTQIATTFDWPWWDWDREREADATLLADIDFLLPSIEELTQHATARREDPYDAARRLLSMGPKAIVVKLGARGADVLAHPRGPWIRVPAYPTQAVDPTGAGDAFCGGFLVGMSRTGDPVEAARFGAVSASFVIEDLGVSCSLRVDPDAAAARLRGLKVARA